MEEKYHNMKVKNTFPTGAQEWYCETCGRHFIIQWPPIYKRIILDEGDETAIHSGGDGGVNMGSAEITEQSGLPKNIEEYLKGLDCSQLDNEGEENV